jgi:hypothetical protein
LAEHFGAGIAMVSALKVYSLAAWAKTRLLSCPELTRRRIDISTMSRPMVSSGVRRRYGGQSHLIALVLTQLVMELPVYSDQSLGWALRRGSSRRLLSMRNRPFTLAYGAMLMLGMAGPALAQDSAVQQPSARQQLQHIHTPQSIDQELVRLTKDLELTPEQQQQVRPLLEEHQNRIQALLDKNPNASRQELGPQIHAISEDTHREIHALLSDHQQQLEKAMQQREHKGEENRRPAPPAIASPEPSPSAS